MRKEYSSITLPKDLLQIIDKHIEGKGYASRCEYLKHLIRKDIREGF